MSIARRWIARRRGNRSDLLVIDDRHVAKVEASPSQVTHVDGHSFLLSGAPSSGEVVISTTYLCDGRKLEVVKFGNVFQVKEYDASDRMVRYAHSGSTLHNAVDHVSAETEEAAADTLGLVLPWRS